MLRQNKFINEWYPETEQDAPLIKRYENLRQLASNDFSPESPAQKMLAEDYGNDIRSVRIQYDFLEVENEVLIKCINEYCDARN